MQVSTFISRVNYVLRGIDDDAPNQGTDEYTFWIDTLNRKKDELYRDIKQWSETYSVASLGSVTASAAPSYNIGATFLAPATEPYITTTEGHRRDLELIKPQENTPNRRQVFISGMNPQTLKFTDEIEADEDIVGGTLYLPGYFLPADVTDDTDTVPLPDPNWGVMAVAAEIAFSDLTYEDKAPDLNAKANALYMQMTKTNRRGVYGKPRVTPTNVRRLTSPR